MFDYFSECLGEISGANDIGDQIPICSSVAENQRDFVI